MFFMTIKDGLNWLKLISNDSQCAVEKLNINMKNQLQLHNHSKVPCPLNLKSSCTLDKVMDESNDEGSNEDARDS